MKFARVFVGFAVALNAFTVVTGFMLHRSPEVMVIRIILTSACVFALIVLITSGRKSKR